jgi:AraC-like DNA-binding protein
MISGVYREYPPPDALAGLVECFWRRERLDPGSDESGVILPDGRVDVVWTADGQTLLAGPQTRFLPRPLEAPFVAVGVRFRPGIGPPLLGLPAHELVDMHVPVEVLDARPAAVLRERLGPLTDPADAVGALGGAIASLADRTETLDPLVPEAARLLDGSQATVGRVARRLALSERQLERRFSVSIGYGPKTLQRILRFQRFIGELRRDRHGPRLAAIAAETGYADQAHLTRESQRLSGLSPAQLARLSPSGHSRAGS